MSPEEQIRDVLDVQGCHGNWNDSPYMRGLYNGLELAMALIEDRTPVYRDEPERYLYTLPAPSGDAAAPQAEVTP